MRHPVQGNRVGRGPADVPVLVGRVGAHHQEVGSGAEAAMAGADFLVIGRPITLAADPAGAAAEIAESLNP